MKVLLTGGAGYIGTHIAVELIEAGNEVVVVDNFINSNKLAIERVEEIVGAKIPFYEFDVRDESRLEQVFQENEIDAVVHLAGLKAVGESVEKPLMYYKNNLDSTFSLLNVMKKCDVKKLVFSSSATVYSHPENSPLDESSEVGGDITNPYGKTKYMIEEILKDIVASDDSWDVTLLRYFNPVGAHESGLIGESPNDIPNNLMPFIAKVAVGELDEIKVFGGDYDTQDGTGVRDFIHVVDLAKGHLAALENIKNGVTTYNLATGKGVSVLELIKTYSKVVGRDLPHEIVDRRAGDVATVFASADKARKELGWIAEKTIEDSCASSWSFIQKLHS
jgi:UDP-glucose-4-epimerase